MKNYYVYAHKNPSGDVFYIGKGTGNRCHERAGRTSKWKAYVKSFERIGLTYSVEIVKTFDNEVDALGYENSLIEELLKEGNILTNTRVSLKISSPEILIENIEDVTSTGNSAMLGRFIKEKRKQAKLTQLDFARKAGLGLRAVKEIETGKPTLRLDTVNKAFWLFGYELGPILKQRI